MGDDYDCEKLLRDALLLPKIAFAITCGIVTLFWIGKLLILIKDVDDPERRASFKDGKRETYEISTSIFIAIAFGTTAFLVCGFAFNGCFLHERRSRKEDGKTTAEEMV